MRMTIPARWVFCAALWFLSTAIQAQDDTFDRETTTQPEKIRRKHPTWFRKPAQATAPEQLAYATRLRAEGETAAAARQFRALVHQWHDSAEAPVAQLAFAEILLDRGQYRKAFNEFQYLIHFYVGDFPYDKAMSNQFRIAHEMMTRRHGKLLLFRGFKAPERALEYFEKIVDSAPNWEKTASALFFIGSIQEERKNYDDAVTAFERVRREFPASPMAPLAAYRGALCRCQTADQHPRDEIRCREALSAMAAYLRDYPDGDDAGEVRTRMEALKKRLSEMYFERAVFYDRMKKQPQAAQLAYEDFLRRFAWSEHAAVATRRVEELQTEVAHLAEQAFARAERNEQKGVARRMVLEGYQDFIKRFPQTPQAALAQERVRTLTQQEDRDHEK